MGRYLIRVEGLLSDELVATFPTLDSSRRPQSVLHGVLSDQATLADILDHLRGAGVSVLDVHRVPAITDPADDRDLSDGSTSEAPPSEGPNSSGLRLIPPV